MFILMGILPHLHIYEQLMIFLHGSNIYYPGICGAVSIYYLCYERVLFNTSTDGWAECKQLKKLGLRRRYMNVFVNNTLLRGIFCLATTVDIYIGKAF